MGIIIANTKTKAQATVKLASAITNFLFEQECDEIKKYFTQSELKALQAAQKALIKVATRAKQ